jgi:flagellar FliL protein
MMRILLVLIVAVVFGGSGFGAGWWYYTQFAPNQAAPPKEPEPPPAGPPAFVNIGPLTVPVLVGDGIQQFVSILVAVEVKDVATADGVRAIAPRLTDAYLTALYGAIGNGQVMQGGLVDVAQLKGKLGAASRKVLGENVARDVLVQVVSQRPL